jgi:3-hydroxyisobutyrate dehydrogenase
MAGEGAGGVPEAVGFIGLGQIGGPMARHLVGWPGGLVVCDARPEACERFTAKGATAVATPAEVAARAGVISLMVRDDAQVWEVVAGDDGILGAAAPGTVIAVHSTIGAGTAAALAEAAAAHGVAVVDAPVSGGAMGARAGTLAVMVGGDLDAVERCRPAFETWAGLVAHLGPIGAGTRAKLARNLLHFTAFVAVSEAQRLAEAAGVDLGLLGEVVRTSDAVTGGPGAIMIRGETGPLPADDPLRPIFEHTRELGEKDLALALGLADELDLDLPLARLALGRLAAGLGVPHQPPAGEAPDRTGVPGSSIGDGGHAGSAGDT